MNNLDLPQLIINLHNFAVNFLIQAFPRFSYFVSSNFYIVKIISAVISIFSGYMVIYYSRKKTSTGEYSEDIFDMYMIGDLPTKKNLHSYKQNYNKIQSQSEKDWKDALKGISGIVDEVLKIAGYKGKTFKDRLANITDVQITNIEELKKAQELVEIIKKDENFKLTRSDADKSFLIFHNSLEELHLFD